MFQDKDKPFSPGENSPRVMLQHWFKKHREWTDCFEIMVAVLKDEQISLLFLLSSRPEDRATQIKPSKKSRISKVFESLFKNA